MRNLSLTNRLLGDLFTGFIEISLSFRGRSELCTPNRSKGRYNIRECPGVANLAFDQAKLGKAFEYAMQLRSGDCSIEPALEYLGT